MGGKLIVLEGIDGSGKATQSELLAEALKKNNKSVIQVTFPDYESQSSSLVKMYLNGNFGTAPEDVNPYAASMFYAVDRFASYKMKWKKFYEQGGIVIADRYTTSNMVHQMTKYDNEDEREKFLKWLEETEYKILGLPTPDMVILLDVPLEISEKLVKERALSGGNMDIHEKHLNYLHKCYDSYQWLCKKYNWEKISCTNKKRLKKVEEIAEEIYKTVNGKILAM